MKERRSVSEAIIKPFACGFGINYVDEDSEEMLSSGSDGERRRSHVVHIDIPRRLKQSLTLSNDTDSIFKFGNSKRRRVKKRAPKKQASTNTIQTRSTSSTSASDTRTCYRFPSRLSTNHPLQKRISVKESKNVFVLPASSSSSCLTDSSHNDLSRNAPVVSDHEKNDKYELFAADSTSSAESHGLDLYVKELKIMSTPASLPYSPEDGNEEYEALVLQLQIPLHPGENLDVEYLPFKIPAMNIGVA